MTSRLCGIMSQQWFVDLCVAWIILERDSFGWRVYDSDMDFA
jgi:hypothetical protein